MHIVKEVAMIITRWINCGVSLFLMSGENHKHGRINCFKIVIFKYFHSSIKKSCLSKPPRSPMKLGVNNQKVNHLLARFLHVRSNTYH